LPKLSIVFLNHNTMKKNPTSYLFVQLRRYFRLKGIHFTFGNHSNTIFIQPNPHLPSISLYFDEQENYVLIRTWPARSYSVNLPSNISLELFLYKLHKYKFFTDEKFNHFGQCSRAIPDALQSEVKQRSTEKPFINS
jgi:hypothetical protein